MTTRILFSVIALWLLLAIAAWGAETSNGIDHAVIDDVRIAFGDEVNVSGPCTSTDSWETGFAPAALLGVRINGTPTQANISFHLFSKVGGVSFDELHACKPGQYYSVHGRLTDAILATSRKRCAIVVESIQPTDARPLRFADFVGREATFEGVAEASGKLRCGTEAAAVEGITDWPARAGAKQIEVRGLVRRAGDGWRIDRPTWRLVTLDDQLGEDVSLVGNLGSLNGRWWFRYRDTKVYLTSAAGPALTFPGSHGRAATVIGKLLRQLRPALEQIYEKSDRDLVPCFVIRNPKVEFLESESDWGNRFGPVYDSFPAIRDGVPELLAESSLRRNLMGNESSAMLYTERNDRTIAAILKDASPQTGDILAARMDDAKTPGPLRLIYAAMLARLSDERGRTFLLAATEVKEQKVSPDAIYCLSLAPFLLPQADARPDMQWAKQRMVELLANRKTAKLVEGSSEWFYRADKTPTVADAAITFSDLPRVLWMVDRAASRQVLLEYVTSKGTQSGDVFQILLASDPPMPIEELLKLESITKDDASRRQILSQVLRHRPLKGIDRFLSDIKEGFVYMDMRDASSPELVAELRPLVAKLDGNAKTHIEMLILLGEKDPVPKLLPLLNDAKWTDKNLVLFELARIGDPRAVKDIARVLRTVDKSYLNADSELNATASIKHALDAIAHAGTSEAIGELITLLDVDLSRFGTYIDRAGFQSIVAAHLIELAGESFATDAAAWHKWHQANPQHYVPRELANPDGPFRTDSDNRIDFGQ